MYIHQIGLTIVLSRAVLVVKEARGLRGKMR
jgi:hypothetical protein